jgi:hypothetical protein
MVFGKHLFFRSQRNPKTGWAFTFRQHADLKRKIVYVNVSDAVKAEAVALEAVAGAMASRAPVAASVMRALGIPVGEHKIVADNGWSFTIQDAATSTNRIVFVCIPDEHAAEAVARELVKGAILHRSEVPPSVITQIGLEPVGTKVVNA